MAWTEPKDFSSGAALTAAELDTYVSDNTRWLKDAATTHGITSDTTPQVLKSARYGCQATKADQSLSDSADVAILFDTEVWDDADFHSTSINTARFTVPTDGTYAITWYLTFDANSTGARAGWIEVNGSTEYDRVGDIASSATVPARFGHTLWLELNANDYVILRARQNSGSSLNADARLTIVRVAV